jgi:hypothetical protein
VFTHFANSTGWGNPLYVIALGLLLAQYCGGFPESEQSFEAGLRIAQFGERDTLKVTDG